jgi:hypothetical protein
VGNNFLISGKGRIEHDIIKKVESKKNSHGRFKTAENLEKPNFRCLKAISITPRVKLLSRTVFPSSRKDRQVIDNRKIYTLIISATWELIDMMRLSNFGICRKQTGRLAKVTAILAKAKINIRAITKSTSDEFGLSICW